MHSIPHRLLFYCRSRVTSRHRGDKVNTPIISAFRVSRHPARSNLTLPARSRRCSAVTFRSASYTISQFGANTATFYPSSCLPNAGNHTIAFLNRDTQRTTSCQAFSRFSRAEMAPRANPGRTPTSANSRIRFPQSQNGTMHGLAILSSPRRFRT